MSRHSDKAREALMDAAEELFAIHGIDGVSNRKITEHAGTANHSAIKYHFGTRDDLLNALIRRAITEVSEFREALPVSEDLDGGLREVVTHRVLPWIYYLAAQPAPFCRAQFLYQVRGYPGLSGIGAEMLRGDELQADLVGRTRHELRGIPASVLRARAGILGYMVLGISAEFERQVAEGEHAATWEELGYFLVDSIVGMVAAPSTAKSEFLDFGGPSRG
ncbi:TetR/AcrR family transcriptional regulator [Glutamicibacter soli]